MKKNVLIMTLLIIMSSIINGSEEKTSSLPSLKKCFKIKAPLIATVVHTAPLSTIEKIQSTIPVLLGSTLAVGTYIEVKKAEKHQLFPTLLAFTAFTYIGQKLKNIFFPSVAFKALRNCWKLRKNVSLSEFESLEEITNAIKIDETSGKLTQSSINTIVTIAQSTDFLYSNQKYPILDVVEKLEQINPITDNLRSYFEALEERCSEASYALLHNFRKELDTDAKKLSMVTSCLKASNEYKEAANTARQERLDKNTERKMSAEIAKIDADTKKVTIDRYAKIKEMITGKHPEHTVNIQ